MSYGVAYKTCFESLDGTLYGIEICIEGFDGRPMEISLDGDAPCVIEWQECGKADVIHSSTCTLRVSNERDRQMLQLMNCRDAMCEVFLPLGDGKRKPYWVGLLDDAVYEESYSFKTGYVTEVVFSDFGVLNRAPFTLKGRQTLISVIHNCFSSMVYVAPVLMDYITLCDPDQGGPLRLTSIMVDCGRFASGGSSDSEVTKSEVLEDVLRPLGLRIVQRGGRFYLHDIEYLLGDASMQSPVVWKGTDAVLRADAAYGRFEVTFEQDAEETLAESDPGLDSFEVDDRYQAYYYDPDTEEKDVGFYIGFRRYYLTWNPHSMMLNTPMYKFKTRPWLSECGHEGYAWRVMCFDSHVYGAQLGATHAVIDNPTVYALESVPGVAGVASEMFSIKTAFLPICNDYEDYKLRINLDLLFSPKKNPMEGDDDWNFNGLSLGASDWKRLLLQVYVPVKLELVDEQNRVLMHYRNKTPHGNWGPVKPGLGQWVLGEAPSFGEMLLAYYNDGIEQTALDGWATNRQSIPMGWKHIPSLYKKLSDGEYVPMPYMAGYLRLTVSNCVFSPKEHPTLRWLSQNGQIRWHLLRDAKITLVKANTIDDGIDTDDIVVSDDLGNKNTDRFTETHKTGCWQKGVAPSARGLLSWNSETRPGDAVHLVIKDGVGTDTLSRLRMACIRTQLSQSQPILSGTAELRREFLAFTDASTPGVFLVTALRQDLHQATEEVTMVRIAEKNPLYVYEWEDPICATEWTEPYKYEWESPICTIVETAAYEHVWGNPVCVMNKQ